MGCENERGGGDKDIVVLLFNSADFESVHHSKQELVDFSICMLINI